MLRVLHHCASAAQETPREEEAKNRKEIFQTAVSLSSWARGRRQADAILHGVRDPSVRLLLIWATWGTLKISLSVDVLNNAVCSSWPLQTLKKKNQQV